MFEVEKIVSFDDPRLDPYRDLKRQWNRHEEEIFIADGEKVVRRLLESPVTILSLLLSERWLESLSPLLQNRPENIQVFLAEKPVIEQLVGYSFAQGVLAVAKVPEPASLEKVLAESSRPQFFVALDGVNNAENIGLMVRNCAAFGAQALIIGETSCPPYLRRAVRSSMGTIFKLPQVQTPDLVKTLAELRSKGIRCVAAHPHSNGKTIYQTDFTQDCCIVFGHEGSGVSEAVQKACDECVAIPMRSEVDSLNVGSAAAVFLFEVNRQRS
jgi:tRNA G18 (ribose-2'-O)-methylase SpoU